MTVIKLNGKREANVRLDRLSVGAQFTLDSTATKGSVRAQSAERGREKRKPKNREPTQKAGRDARDALAGTRFSGAKGNCRRNPATRPRHSVKLLSLSRRRKKASETSVPSKQTPIKTQETRPTREYSNKSETRTRRFPRLESQNLRMVKNEIVLRKKARKKERKKGITIPGDDTSRWSCHLFGCWEV